MANYLLIDGNSIGYACQDAPKLRVGERQVQAVYGFLRVMRRLLNEYPGYRPIVLWDGHAQWRYDLFPLYKDNRDKDPKRVIEREAYKEQKPGIMKALEHLGISQMLDLKAEADDLAGYLSRYFGAKGKVVMITGDKDWCQLISNNVSWHRCMNPEKKCGVENFQEVTGFKTPDQFVEAKCLMGDTSDNVSGVGKIGEKGAVEFFNRFDSVEQFLDLVEMGNIGGFFDTLSGALLRFAKNETPPDSSKYGKMLPMQDAFYRNLKLMKLDSYKPGMMALNVRRGKFDVEQFRELCNEHLFLSITARLDIWLEPFKQLNKQLKTVA